MTDQYIEDKLPEFSDLIALEELDLSENDLVGSIPQTFLSGSNPQAISFIDLSGNNLEGIVPKTFANFKTATIRLSDNEFVGIDPSVCKNSEFECDGILCKPGTCNCDDYQTIKGNPFGLCPGAIFYGSSDC